jgi:VIT1/CCC1 family predicted Fe2+/Mn2+ transporter
MKVYEQFLGEFIYGATDGIITTFSIVAGAAGGDLIQRVITILGISNVLSDGYSMGVSRYLSSKAEIEQGLLKEKDAVQSGIFTFLSFVIVGVMPILPFFFYKGLQAKKISLGIATLLFAMIGFIKGYVLKQPVLYKSIETLFIGLSAALISYFVGIFVNKLH